jgi:hypothetical protein
VGGHASDIGEAAAHAPGDCPCGPWHRRKHSHRPHLSTMHSTSAHSQHRGLPLCSELIFFLHAFPVKRQVASTDKLHVKAATFLSLVRLARSKQDPINRGHRAQCQHCPPPARAQTFVSCPPSKWLHPYFSAVSASTSI